MAQITGIVNCLLVGDDVAFTTIDDGTGFTETFILFFGNNPSTDPKARRAQDMWVSLLQEAKAHNLTVIVTPISDDSSYVASVQLGRFESSGSEPL